ncbi:MAG: flagellar basal body rod protein FlgB [Vicinamibacterales bacterium]
MNEISDSAVIAALRRQMTVAVAKQVASAGNLANVDTPGYQTKDVTFDETLAKQFASSGVTNTKHIPLSGGDGLKTETPELAARRDGNNVQLDRELLNMGKAAGDFAAAQTALAAKFRLVRYAINESR